MAPPHEHQNSSSHCSLVMSQLIQMSRTSQTFKLQQELDLGQIHILKTNNHIRT